MRHWKEWKRAVFGAVLAAALFWIALRTVPGWLVSLSALIAVAYIVALVDQRDHWRDIARLLERGRKGEDVELDLVGRTVPRSGLPFLD